MVKVFNVPIHHFGAPFNRIEKRILLHVVIAIFISSIVTLPSSQGFDYFLKFFVLIFMGDMFQAFSHILVSIKLEEKYDWIKDTTKRVVYGIFWHTFATFANYFTIPAVILVIAFDLSFSGAFSALIHLWYLPISLVAFVLVFAVAGQFLINWKKSLAAEEKLQAEMMNYKYESLRNQINPHFLLDSFQSLKKLVFQDQQKAAIFIQKISDLYRHVLDVKDKEFIPLKEELKFIEPYIELLKTRYGDKVVIRPNIQPDHDDLIAPMTLQFLIENAIENSYRSNGKPFNINLKKENGQILVSNSRQNQKSDLDMMNSKLKNIQQQYQFYSKKPVEMVESADEFLVKLPILKQA